MENPFPYGVAVYCPNHSWKIATAQLNGIWLCDDCFQIALNYMEEVDS